MIYENIKKGTFISRPNRFIAEIMIDGKTEICHVKNTGRCKELLTYGATVIVQEISKAERKTKFDLIAVYKGDMLINIDSQAPNKVFYEWLKNYFKDVRYIKPEAKYKNSRFDFYIEAENKKIYAEIKGVTLEENGVVLFPDAPTERGIKHINELIECKKEGFEAFIFFVVQMEKARFFTPNKKTHPEFASALKKAKENGVNIICVTCSVKEAELKIKDFLECRL